MLCFYTALCLVKKLEFFKCEVSQTSVALTAAGLFNITPRLFPQVGLFRPHNGVSIIFYPDNFKIIFNWFNYAADVHHNHVRNYFMAVSVIGETSSLSF